MHKNLGKSVRLTLNLNEGQKSFVDKICRQIRRKKGERLNTSGVFRALICVVRKMEIDVKGVKDEKKLEARFLRAFEECK